MRPRTRQRTDAVCKPSAPEGQVAARTMGHRPHPECLDDRFSFRANSRTFSITRMSSGVSSTGSRRLDATPGRPTSQRCVGPFMKPLPHLCSSAPSVAAFSDPFEAAAGAPGAKSPPRTLRIYARYTYIAVGKPAKRHSSQQDSLLKPTPVTVQLRAAMWVGFAAWADRARAS
jgi:hypothetical protein